MDTSFITRMICGFTSLLFAVTANAALIPQADGTVFDDDLNIYWLQDANLAATENFGVGGIEPDGRMLWDTAHTWIAAMNAANYLGQSNWRLVNMDRDGDDIVIYCTFEPAKCADNEYGHLFHEEGITYFDQRDFINIQNDTLAGYYWSGTEYLLHYAWWFRITLGGQNVDPKQDSSALHYVWPVRDGAAPATLSISKASDPISVAIGTTYKYIIDVQNTGTTSLSNVVVSDTLPTGVTLLSAPLGCFEPVIGTVNCNYATLAAGASLHIELDVQAPGTPGFDITNTAYVSADGSSSVSASAITYIDYANADIYIEKFAPAETQAGELFSYQLNAGNNGLGVATDVTVTDVLPEYMAFNEVISAQGNSCAHDTSTHTVECSLGDLGRLESDLIQIVVRPLRVGPTSNTASIAATSPDNIPGNNESTLDTSVVFSDASVTDNVNAIDDHTLDFGFAPLGQSVTGDLTITNTGSENLTVHNLPTPLPVPFQVITAACFGTTLLPGESCSETIGFLPTENGSHSADFNLQLDAILVPIKISGVGGELQTDIAITKDADITDLAVGDRVEFTIVVSNSSTPEEGATADVLVTDKLPAPFRIPEGESAIVDRGDPYNPASGTWVVGLLAPGESATLIIPAVVDRDPPGGRSCITNTATAEIVNVLPTLPPVVDSSTGNNTAKELVGIGECADLGVGEYRSDFGAATVPVDSIYPVNPYSWLQLKVKRGGDYSCTSTAAGYGSDCSLVFGLKSTNVKYISKITVMPVKKGYDADPVTVVSASFRAGSSPAFTIEDLTADPCVELGYCMTIGFRTSEFDSQHEGVLEIRYLDPLIPTIVRTAEISLSGSSRPDYGHVVWDFPVFNDGPTSFKEPFVFAVDLPLNAVFDEQTDVNEDEVAAGTSIDLFDGLLQDDLSCEETLLDTGQQRIICKAVIRYYEPTYECFRGSTATCRFAISAAITGTFSHGLKYAFCSASSDPVMENNGDNTELVEAVFSKRAYPGGPFICGKNGGPR